MGNMIRIVMILLIVGICCPANAQELEHLMGQADFQGIPGTQMQIAQTTTPQGEKPPVSVTFEKILAYSKGGISFKYESLMTVSSDDEPEGITIKIECEMSPMVAIQEYRSQTNPEVVLGTLMDSLKAALKERKVAISDDSIRDTTMKIGSSNQTGKLIEFSIGGLQHKTSIFAIPAVDRTIGLIFQHSLDETELAKRQFEIIAESLTIQ
jgi:hypothetical protein